MRKGVDDLLLPWVLDEFVFDAEPIAGGGGAVLKLLNGFSRWLCRGWRGGGFGWKSDGRLTTSANKSNFISINWWLTLNFFLLYRQY